MNTDMFHEGSDRGYRSRALDLIANGLADAAGQKRDSPSLTDEEVASALQLDIESYKVWLKELSTLMGKAIRGLKKMEQIVITLFYYEELTLKEIAGILDASETEVSQLHAKAIVQLTKKLKNDGELDNGS